MSEMRIYDATINLLWLGSYKESVLTGNFNKYRAHERISLPFLSKYNNKLVYIKKYGFYKDETFQEFFGFLLYLS